VSISALDWVFKHSPTRLADRLVLLVLADYANRAWEAWPGVNAIAKRAKLAPRVVQASLARLVRDGHIERVIQGAPDDRVHGGHRTNLYRIVRGAASVHPSGVHGDDTPLLPGGVSAGDTPDTTGGGSAHRSDHDPDPPGADHPPGVHGDDTPPATPGVQASDTPEAGRGVVRGRDGVSFADAMGCRETTPKPSVEPNTEPPLSREPRGLGPTGEPTEGGQRSDQDPPPLDADQRRARIHQAATILAERASERAATIGNRPAWVGAVAERLATQHATAGHRLLAEHPDLPAAALADLLADPDTTEARVRQRDAEEATRRLIRDTAAQPADRIRSAEQARQLREQLRSRPA